jgi:phage baseplate assembly protein W
MTAARHVEEAIRMWERRVEVEKVDARIDVSGAIRVEVVYKITSTGAVERLEHLVSSTPGSAGPPAPR